MTAPIQPLPPLAALFLTHFDDLKGQTTTFYRSISPESLPPGLIEHTTLPSGLHTLKEDLVLFTHGTLDLPGVGLFRSVEVGHGRGRSMGTLGVVLADGVVDDLFALRPQLEATYDRLSDGDTDPFTSEDTARVLDAIWKQHRASGIKRRDEIGRVRDIVQGRRTLGPSHPISFFPALLVILNPLLITVYKYAIAGRRILIHSPPPLLPLGAFAYCIQALSVPPAGAVDATSSTFIGNVGLMDLDRVKKRKGGWIANSIYRSHTSAYDLFIDLSSPSSSSSTTTTPSTSTPSQETLPTHATLYVPSPTPGEPTTTTYSFADIPLYRSLLLLQVSPPSLTVSSKFGVRGNMWIWAFEIFERAWKLCRGVCEYALGQGVQGEIALEQGEEDARLIDDPSLDPDDDEEERSEDEGEDEAIRVGRLLLRQFHHNSYHLFSRLRAVRRGTGGALTDKELKELIGKSWRLGSIGGVAAEAKWWNDLARTWGIVMPMEDEDGE